MKAFIVLSVLLSAAFAACQDTPKVEVFGGYSLLHIDTQGINGPSLDSLCNSIINGLCPAGTFNVHPNFNGWNVSAQANLNGWLGVKADFSGHYATPLTVTSGAQSVVSDVGVTGFPPKATVYSFLFGPVGYRKIDRVTPFAHALFGGNRVGTATITIPPFPPLLPNSTPLSISDTAFAMAFGGGVDFEANKHISIRVGQVDYLYTRHNFSYGVAGVATHQNNLRVSAGIVFTFGAGREASIGPTVELGPSQPHTIKNESPSTQEPLPRTTVEAQILPVGLVVRSRGSGGVEIVSVAQGSASSRAGLQPGDGITAVDGKAVRSTVELASELSSIGAGDKVRISFMARGYWQTEAILVVGEKK